MNWPQATVEILCGAGFLIWILASTTDFFQTVFGREVKEVEIEVIPSGLIDALQVVIDEMRDEAIQIGGEQAKHLIDWAKVIDEALNEEYE